MSDLALPFLLLIGDDALAFAAFKSLMQKVSARSATGLLDQPMGTMLARAAGQGFAVATPNSSKQLNLNEESQVKACLSPILEKKKKV